MNVTYRMHCEYRQARQAFRCSEEEMIMTDWPLPTYYSFFLWCNQGGVSCSDPHKINSMALSLSLSSKQPSPSLPSLSLGYHKIIRLQLNYWACRGERETKTSSSTLPFPPVYALRNYCVSRKLINIEGRKGDIEFRRASRHVKNKNGRLEAPKVCNTMPRF